MCCITTLEVTNFLLSSPSLASYPALFSPGTTPSLSPRCPFHPSLPSSLQLLVKSSLGLIVTRPNPSPKTFLIPATQRHFITSFEFLTCSQKRVLEESRVKSYLSPALKLIVWSVPASHSYLPSPFSPNPRYKSISFPLQWVCDSLYLKPCQLLAP